MDNFDHDYEQEKGAHPENFEKENLSSEDSQIEKIKVDYDWISDRYTINKFIGSDAQVKFLAEKLNEVIEFINNNEN